MQHPPARSCKSWIPAPGRCWSLAPGAESAAHQPAVISSRPTSRRGGAHGADASPRGRAGAALMAPRLRQQPASTGGEFPALGHRWRLRGCSGGEEDGGWMLDGCRMEPEGLVMCFWGFLLPPGSAWVQQNPDIWLKPAAPLPCGAPLLLNPSCSPCGAGSSLAQSFRPTRRGLGIITGLGQPLVRSPACPRAVKALGEPPKKCDIYLE